MATLAGWSAAEFLNLVIVRLLPWYRVEVMELDDSGMNLAIGGVRFCCGRDCDWELRLFYKRDEEYLPYCERLNDILRGRVRDDAGLMHDPGGVLREDVLSIARAKEIMSRDLVPGEFDVGREVEFSQGDGVWCRGKLLAVLPKGKAYRFISDDADTPDDWIYWKQSRIIRG